MITVITVITVITDLSLTVVWRRALNQCFLALVLQHCHSVSDNSDNGDNSDISDNRAESDCGMEEGSEPVFSGTDPETLSQRWYGCTRFTHDLHTTGPGPQSSQSVVWLHMICTWFAHDWAKAWATQQRVWLWYGCTWLGPDHIAMGLTLVWLHVICTWLGTGHTALSLTVV